jgi:hypothetical protein
LDGGGTPAAEGARRAGPGFLVRDRVPNTCVAFLGTAIIYRFAELVAGCGQFVDVSWPDFNT